MKTVQRNKMQMYILVVCQFYLFHLFFDVRFLYLFLFLFLILTHSHITLDNWICFGWTNFEAALAYKWCMSYAEMISMMLTIKFPVNTHIYCCLYVCDCIMDAIDVRIVLCSFIFGLYKRIKKN